MPHPLLGDTPGQKHLLLGNEAIVRGSLEAGVAFISCYPGTPSSEVPDTFYRLAPEGDFYFEYSVNEKVALEVGGGATLAGSPTLVTMKHVGVNVAADPLMTLAYIGTPGGLVLLSADDPGCHSSQNEQDNRYFARLAGMPVLEPSTAQEAKDMARDALLLSMEWQQPVMLRTTTRINHLRGVVEFGPLPGAKKGPAFAKEFMRYAPIPAVARVRHVALLEFLEKAREHAETSPWNTISGEGKLGVISSGVARAYVKDALAEPQFEGSVKHLELGFSYPLPDDMLSDFLRSCDSVLVVEELEPIVENHLRALAQKLDIKTEIKGKSDILPLNGEYETTMARRALADLAGVDAGDSLACAAPQKLPMRPPNLCAGCSHRSAYYTVRSVFGDDAVYSNDIGCYTLGILPPLSAADFLLCMGSSVSSGGGFAKADDRPVVAFIGDSTFFHSGVTGLINAVFNDHDLLVVVLDNGVTAMTGHQPHPGADRAVMADHLAQVDIETVVKGCGVEHIATVPAGNYAKAHAVFEDMKAKKGVRVVISREPCILFAKRKLKKEAPVTAYVAEQTEAVRECMNKLACPAFELVEDDVVVNEHMCVGCMFCMQICPNIKSRKRSAAA